MRFFDIRAVCLSAPVLAMAFASASQGVIINYDPTNFGIVGSPGAFVRINGVGYSQNVFSGGPLDLNPGTYNVIVSSANVGDFTVAGDGTVTTSAPGLVGGANQVSLYTVAVNVSISPLWQSNWTVDWGGSSTGNKLMYLPVASNYSSWYGRGGISGLKFDLAANGDVAVHDVSPVGENITGGSHTLAFPTEINDITVTVATPPPGSGGWNFDGGTASQNYSAIDTLIHVYGGSYNLNVFGVNYYVNAINIPADARAWTQTFLVNKDGTDYAFVFAGPAVPEPASAALLGGSALLLTIRRRRA